ncbi:hypothetical protein DM01DRAFT_299899 [Hesseltinella vesiculosa]|uniref:ACB domain-containing protein n=1 Tax=Hesseltinella vesiculosa TaxID=101127 RepID=A0A1X2GRJ1_9FUNG|nr:hypothetical protein DM01DRAFT_299899 [Hesseltinella vesiculosa]
MSSLEAKHKYVETLLAVCTEAYRKPQAKTQVQQIIQSFASIQPDRDESEDDQDSDTTTDQDISDSGESSGDAEEKAYLRDIQNSVPTLTPSRSMQSRTSNRSRQYNRRSWHEKQPRSAVPRAPSVESTPSMMTALSSPFHRRPSQPPRRPPSSTSQDLRVQPFVDESIVNNTINPWATTQVPALPPQQHIRHQPHQDHHFDSDNESTNTRSTLQQRYFSNSSRRPSTSSASHPHQRPLRTLPIDSPLMDSTTSSVTATGPAHAPPPPASLGDPHMRGRYLTEQQYTSVVALGPATKRALETLQSEIIALNERIDGLRQELIHQQKQNKVLMREKDLSGWQWVLKAALKHASVNIFTLLILFFILYQRKSPIAFAIVNSIFKNQRKLGSS